MLHLNNMKLLFMFLFFYFFPQFSVVASSKESITLPLNNWASQRVLTYVIGDLIEQQFNHTVNYQEIGAYDQWGALRKGIVHIQIEVWQQSMGAEFSRMLAQQHIHDLGSHSAVVREEWWYPDYVEQKCAGLPNWQALNECAYLFSELPLSGKGIYYTGPWEYHDADLIRALDLDFTIERLSNEKALWHKLQQSVAEKRAIMLLNWSPNWTDVRMKGKFVEFPHFEQACESNPKWGINPYLVHDCGNLKQGWLKKVAWPGLKSKWPCVHQFIRQVDFTKDMIAEASALVIADGFDERQAANIWLEKYRKQVSDWLNTQCIAN